MVSRDSKVHYLANSLLFCWLLLSLVWVWVMDVGHCWRSRDELISNVLLWTPLSRREKTGRPARTYIQQLCADTECSLEDLPGAMDYREEWLERVREILASGTTWWWFTRSDLLAGTVWSVCMSKSPENLVRFILQGWRSRDELISDTLL